MMPLGWSLSRAQTISAQSFVVPVKVTLPKILAFNKFTRKWATSVWCFCLPREGKTEPSDANETRILSVQVKPQVKLRRSLYLFD